MKQVQEKYLAKHPNSEWRYDLRIRYLPTSLQDLCDKDKVTFHYYYDQVIRRHSTIFINLYIIYECVTIV